MSKFPSLAPVARQADVLTLGMSWPAWVRGKTAAYGVATSMINDPGAPDSILTTYGYRQYVGSDGTDPNWYYLLTGDAAAEQVRANDQAMMLAKINMARGYLWYPRAVDISVGPPTDESYIYDAGIGLYLTGPKPHKFWLILQDGKAAYDGNTPPTWGNFDPAFVDNWVTLFQDRQYVRISFGGISNRPVVGLYKGTSATHWDLAHLAIIDAAAAAAGLGAPIYGQMNGIVADANALGCLWITKYLALPAGSGQQPYSAQVTADQAVDVLSGSLQQRWFVTHHCSDNRPRPSGYTSWSDTSTYTEIETHLRQRYAMSRGNFQLNSGHVVTASNIDEVDESGPFFPTDQLFWLGVNSPNWGLYLDAWLNVLYERYPAVYDDHYAFWAESATIGRTGTGWALVQSLTGPSGGATGAYQYSENVSTTVGDSFLWTSPYNVTRIQFVGRKYPAGGTFNMHHDAVGDTLVDQSAGGTSYEQVLYDTGVLTAGVHTLSGTVVTGCSASRIIATVSRPAV